MSYHLCARQIGQCVGLGRGIQEYHLCARNANCKKMDREKVEKVVRKIKKSKAKQIIKKAVEGFVLDDLDDVMGMSRLDIVRKKKQLEEANKGNRKEEEIKKLKDIMNEVIEKGSTKYMNNLIKNEKDPKNAQKFINKNQINLSNLEKKAIDILSKLYDNIGAEKGRQKVGTALIGKFKQASRLNTSRAKAVIKKYYKNR
jgi:hypothetical protein